MSTTAKGGSADAPGRVQGDIRGTQERDRGPAHEEPGGLGTETGSKK